MTTETFIETNAAVESLDGFDRPKPEWVRGECPCCGEPLVSNCYYVGGQGYLVIWDCWASLGMNPTCTYRRVV